MIFWLLLILFGWLFMGLPFFLYLAIAYVAMLFLACKFPDWFNGL